MTGHKNKTFEIDILKASVCSQVLSPKCVVDC